MRTRAAHIVRYGAAPVAWVAGIGCVLGLLPTLLFGIPSRGRDTPCGTIWDSQWRGENAFCHRRMVGFIAGDALLLLVAIAAGVIWWRAYRADDVD